MPYIFFRSHRGRSDSSTSSNSLRYGRGFDWDTLRLYASWDNTRDIAWMKSWVETLVRNRIETPNFPIYLIQDTSTENEFSTISHPLSKSEFAKEIARICRESAKKYGHVFHTLSGKNEEIKNSMIIILWSNLNTEDVLYIKRLSLLNDVVFVHIFHPFEKNPDSSVLFSFKTIKEKEYKKEFERKRKEIQIYLIENWCSYIDIYTHESIYDKINFFFKNRYKHG